MKQFGMVLLGLSLAMFASCSKDDESEVPWAEQQPEEAKPEPTGKFEVQWSCMGIPLAKGGIEIGDEYMSVGDFPAEALFGKIIYILRESATDNPEHRIHLADKIGNIFFADSYKYSNAVQVLKYVFSDSSHAAIKGIISVWSLDGWVITQDYGGTFIIDPPEDLTISFGVEADGVPYRIDLVHQEKEPSADFDAATGLWSFTYWFDSFLISNLKTGQQYDKDIKVSGMPQRNDRRDTIQLQFKSIKRTEPAEEMVATY